MKSKRAGLKTARNPACPVCAASQTAFKYRIARHHFDVFVCAACASEFQHPFPKNADAFYDEGYYTGTAAFNYQDERKKEYYHRFVHNARLKSIRDFLTGCPKGAEGPSDAKHPKFLDVGCAFGAFARAAASFGFDAYGLDVSAYAVREGNKASDAAGNPAKLFEGDLSHLPRHEKKIFARESFAAITLVEVAEHLKTPRTDLATAFSLLRPGGVLVIQTANFEGLQAVRGGSDYHYYLPGHLIYYTATGLKSMLSQIGFCEFKEFFPVDFSLFAKWRKAWGDVRGVGDLGRFWKMSLYHWKSQWKKKRPPADEQLCALCAQVAAHGQIVR